MSEGHLPNITAPFVEAVESAAPLDPIGGRVGKIVRAVIPAGKVKGALRGDWVGHSLHPLLTDVVIGSFTSATMLDLLGGDRDGRATERLITIGIAAYFPTALTGASDYSEEERSKAEIRRVGLVHASTNALALGLYSASLRARRNGNRGRGKLLGLLGASALGAAGHLGGHLSYGLGVRVEPTQ